MDKKVRLKVGNITNSQGQTPAYAMVLQEVGGTRQLPIIIGPSEAQSITYKLNNIRSLRPLTHDLFATALVTYDIIVKEVLIYKATEGLFYSYVYFDRDGIEVHIDARTSDAIALALHFNCPIYVYETILEKERIPDSDVIRLSEKDKEGNPPSARNFRESLKTKDIKTLKRALNAALKEENYELASVLRDEISNREK